MIVLHIELQTNFFAILPEFYTSLLTSWIILDNLKLLCEKSSPYRVEIELQPPRLVPPSLGHFHLFLMSGFNQETALQDWTGLTEVPSRKKNNTDLLQTEGGSSRCKRGEVRFRHSRPIIVSASVDSCAIHT